MDFVTINVKTANHENRCSISEIGIAIVKNSIVEESKSWLVRPKDNYYDAVSLYYTAITPEMTENAPSFTDVWKEVQPYLEGKIVIARFAPSDMYVIKEALTDAGIEYPTFNFYSLHSIIKYTVPNLPSYGLYNACKHYNLNDEEPKRAEADATLSAKVLLSISKQEGKDDVIELYETQRFVAGYFSKTDGFKPQYRKSINTSSSKKKELMPADPEKFDDNNYFYGKNVVVTGDFRTTIAKTRNEIEQDIINIGGFIKPAVSKSVDILIVGQQTSKNVKDGMSRKQKDAIALIEKGEDIEILVEEEFWTQMYK